MSSWYIITAFQDLYFQVPKKEAPKKETNLKKGAKRQKPAAAPKERGAAMKKPSAGKSRAPALKKPAFAAPALKT